MFITTTHHSNRTKVTVKIINGINDIESEVKVDLKKIMIVDDESDQIYTIKEALEDSQEYEVTPANNGDECLELLKKSEEIPDIILLDIMMPNMSGWEVFDRMKSNQSWKDIPIVFLTARTDKIAENAGEILGDAFIEKPVDIEDLKRRIDKILNDRNQKHSP